MNFIYFEVTWRHLYSKTGVKFNEGTLVKGLHFNDTILVKC